MPVYDIHDGDIVIENTLKLSSQFLSDVPIGHPRLFNTLTPSNFSLAVASWHAGLYLQEEGSFGSVVHSQLGLYHSGVKKINWARFSPPTQKLGSFYVLRCAQPEIAAKMTEVALRWAPKLPREIIALRDGSMLTPYGSRSSFFSANKKIPKELENAISLYRAFRAFLRNTTTFVDQTHPFEATPLSKKRGVQCSDFVAYTHRVALIHHLFPEGLPKSILMAMQQVELYKEKKIIKKLELLPPSLFFGLHQVASQLISSEALDELSTAVKGEGIEFFSAHAFANPHRWQLVGYVCVFQQTCGKLKLMLLDEHSYQKLTKNGTVDRSMLVMQADLERCNATTSTEPDATPAFS